MSETFTTRAGCRITVERVGPSVGVTIHPKDGKATLYACGADEAVDVANMLAPPDLDLIASIKREARAKALEDAAEVLFPLDTKPWRCRACFDNEGRCSCVSDGRGGLMAPWPPHKYTADWLRDSAARERGAK